MWFEGLPQDKVGRVLQALLPEPTDDRARLPATTA